MMEPMEPTEGRITEPGKVVITNANMDCIDLQVQHCGGSGKPLTDKDGTLGISVIVMPSGQPRIIVSVMHPDGTRLDAALPNATIAQLVVDLLGNAAATCVRVVDDVNMSVKQ